MAEGGYEEVELENFQKLGEKYEGDYDALDADELTEEFNRLGLLDPARGSGEVERRMEYVEDLLVDEHGYDETSFTTDPPNPKRDAKSISLAITRDKKEFLRETLGVDIRVGDGPASKELIKEMKVDFDSKERQSSIAFGGVKVVVSGDRGKTYKYSDNKKNAAAVEKFKELLENAKIEHGETLEGSIDSSTRSSGLEPDEDVTQDIALNVRDDIEDLVEEREEEVVEQSRGVVVTEQEVREFSGLLDPKGSAEEKIKALEITANQYRLKALNESDLVREQFYKNVWEVAELKADAVRMVGGLKPEHEEAIALVEREIENNDLTRLERFKKWAKENMLGLSAVAITIAGIITTVIIGARGAVKTGAAATGKLAKAIANLAKKAGPVLATLFSVLATAISWGAQGLLWLASNLWVLAIAVAWVIYDRAAKKRK